MRRGDPAVGVDGSHGRSDAAVRIRRLRHRRPARAPRPRQNDHIGFVLDGPGLELVYISGDNASLDVARTIAERIGAVDVAVLFAGAVQLAHRFDCAYLTLSSDFAAERPRSSRRRPSSPCTPKGGRICVLGGGRDCVDEHELVADVEGISGRATSSRFVASAA